MFNVLMFNVLIFCLRNCLTRETACNYYLRKCCLFLLLIQGVDDKTVIGFCALSNIKIYSVLAKNIQLGRSGLVGYFLSRVNKSYYQDPCMYCAQQIKSVIFHLSQNINLGIRRQIFAVCRILIAISRNCWILISVIRQLPDIDISYPMLTSYDAGMVSPIHYSELMFQGWEK